MHLCDFVSWEKGTTELHYMKRKEEGKKVEGKKEKEKEGKEQGNEPVVYIEALSV